MKDGIFSVFWKIEKNETHHFLREQHHRQPQKKWKETIIDH
jgi:hypothetical protein